MEKNGADYTKIKYVEVPFPEMGAALEAKRVDAAFTVEPAVQRRGRRRRHADLPLLRRDGAEPQVATYFASKQYIAENKDVVERFKRAMEKSLDYASANEAEVRAVVGEYTRSRPR